MQGYGDMHQMRPEPLPGAWAGVRAAPRTDYYEAQNRAPVSAYDYGGGGGGRSVSYGGGDRDDRIYNGGGGDGATYGGYGSNGPANKYRLMDEGLMDTRKRVSRYRYSSTYRLIGRDFVNKRMIGNH